MTDERSWWPPGYSRPAFQVRRQVYGTATGGDYVRGSGVLTTPHTALRYPRSSTSPTSLTSGILGKSILHVRPRDHTTVEIQWGWPAAPFDTWLEVALVRSTFGRPSTVNDGQTIFRAERLAFMDAYGGLPLDPLTGAVADPPLVLDSLLTAGYWYNYSLFFKVSPVEWVRGMVDSCLLPRDLKHTQHLWDNVPPYYQWVDDNLANRGYLKSFLKIFGFELDQCREFIESWQHLYDVDRSPIRLLRQLGLNFGVPYEEGIGDIRYRSLMAEIGDLYEVRGTKASLNKLIVNMSKYPCIVTSGVSLMLTPDDSDFYQGIGNWAALHPETVISTVNDIEPVGAPLAPDSVRLSKAAPDEVIPPYGRGALRVWSLRADATAKMLITVGDGLQYNGTTTPDTIDLTQGVEKLPKSYGIPVEPGSSYGFNVSVMTTQPPLTTRAVLLWFDQRGEPYQMISSVLSTPVGAADNLWYDVNVEGTAPANAVFLVPGVLFTNRTAGSGTTDSPYIYLAGAMAYFIGGSGTSLVIPPDRYLTMGHPGELIGPASVTPLFDPFLLGSPEVVTDTSGQVVQGTGIFTDFFRQQLSLDQTMMSGASVRVAYFSQAASFTNPYDPLYTSVVTLADLQTRLGWGVPLLPYSDAQTTGTVKVGNSIYVISNAFTNSVEWVDSPVVAAAFFINGTVNGVTDPIIFITRAPFEGRVFRQADQLTAAPNSDLNGNSSFFSWQTPVAGQQAFPTEGPLEIYLAPPSYEYSHLEHAWLFPQRVNMLANPSFELGINHWKTNGTLSRVRPPRDPLVWEGHVSGGVVGRSLVLESNFFPTNVSNQSGLWTIQLMIRGTGRVRIGLLSWEDSFSQTGVDWGPDTDVWTLPGGDGYLHIYALRHVSDASTALVRIECDGSDFFVDNLLCEPEWLLDWPYFDGDTTYGAMDDFGWYGGETLQGQTYSTWYNHRRAVVGRLFAWSISDNDFTVTDAEVETQGFVYKWVPAGVRVIPHMDVLWIGDVQPPVPNTNGPVTASKTSPTDALGVSSAWAVGTVFPSTDTFPGLDVFPVGVFYPALDTFPGLDFFPSNAFVYPSPMPFPGVDTFPSTTLLPANVFVYPAWFPFPKVSTFPNTRLFPTEGD